MAQLLNSLDFWNLLDMKIPTKQIAAFCRRYKITELAIFGSALRKDFSPQSDIDVLVTFAPEAHYSLMDLVSIQEELKVIFGRDVDLVEKAGLRNPFRRSHILKSMQVVYAS